MPKVSLHFKIHQPFKKWKENFDSQAETREKLGIKVIYIKHEPNNEREISGIMEVTSLEGFKKYAHFEHLNKRGHNIVANLVENNPDSDY